MDNNLGQIFQDKAKIREIVQKSLVPTNHSVYLHLLDHMRSISKEYLKYWLGALQDCLSLINIQAHDELLNLIWSFDWYMEDMETVKVYMDFVVHLISSQTGFLFGCFTMISHNFGVYFEKDKLRSSEEVSSLLHQLLKSLIEIVPSSLNLLSKCVVSGFPHIASTNIEQSSVILYVNNILFLTTYCPSLKESVFEVIFDKINQLDALLPSNNKLIEEEELFTFEEDQEISTKQEFNKNIFIMDKVISSVNNYIYSNSSNLVQRDEIMDILLRLFDTKILTTYKSKYIQLILFYLTSLSPHYHVRFLSNLFEKFLDSRVHIKTRESAVNYVASYLCRANFVLFETIKNSIGLLITQLHNYIDTIKSTIMPPPTILLSNSTTTTSQTLNPPVQHALFYTTCQSVLYILCFLYDELLANGLDHEYFISLNLEKIIKSSFNPIYYCSVDIVEALSDKIYSFGLSECRDMILNCNKITRVYEDNPIDTHFPFDPYYTVLSNAKTLITPIYNNWEELGGSRNSINKRRESIAYSDSSSLPSMSLDQSGSLDPQNFLHNSTGSLTPNYYSFSLNNNSFRGNLSSSYDSM